MENHHDQLEALRDIRSMMERSTRFLSLSGLSGIWAGCCALAGIAAMYIWLRVPAYASSYLQSIIGHQNWGLSYRGAFLAIGLATFFIAMLGVYFFNARRARLNGHVLWDAPARRMLIAMMIPMAAGGIFCLALTRYDLVGLIAPTTLVFYGLSLVHIDKFTIGHVRILGLALLALGSIGLFRPEFGLHLWAIGFGLFHILYGAWIYLTLERK
jgi:predicted lysophospholipase L1 biosynthesis ABC-type transport system permease subunit